MRLVSAPKLLDHRLELALPPRRPPARPNLDADAPSRHEHGGLEGGRARQLGQGAQQLEVRVAERLHRHDPERIDVPQIRPGDRKSTRLNSSHGYISYAVFCLKKKKKRKKNKQYYKVR